MLRYVLISLLWLPAAAQAADDDIDRINGNIRIEASRTVGDLSTVNGSIDVGENARARDVETVNGGVRLRPRAVAGSVETVNGSVKAGSDVRLEKSAATVNGEISLAERTQVAGSLSSVNGDLRLDAANVSGRLSTVNGDITVGADSYVGGGILVEESRGWKFGRRHVPLIVIGPRAVVDGALKFEREVRLHVSRSARIGRVEGATPVVFDDDEP